MCLTFYIFNVDTQISKSVKPKYAVRTTVRHFTLLLHTEVRGGGGGFENQCFPGLWHWTTGEGKNITNLREWHVVQACGKEFSERLCPFYDYSNSSCT